MFLLRGFKDLLFPARCQGCNKQIDPCCSLQLCPDCAPQLVPVAPPLCLCCGTPFISGKNHLCGECLQDHFAFACARSLFFYQEPVRTLLVQLKFRGSLARLDTLSVLAGQFGAAHLCSEPDLIMPVPLHKQRLRHRGFNQSLLLARACLPDWQQKIRTDLLLRHQPTVPQTSLSGRARRNNLKKAFSVVTPDQVAGKSILLVDDIFTTGSTLHECARVLNQAGAARVEAFTLARAL